MKIENERYDIKHSDKHYESQIIVICSVNKKKYLFLYFDYFQKIKIIVPGYP
jgi:hypothetical protein